MKFEPITYKDSKGRQVTLRNAEPADGAELLDYMKTTAVETPFLLRELEEVTMTVEQEEAFIASRLQAERELLLVAIVDCQLAGCCSFSPVGAFQRNRHRCGVAIALYRRFYGIGLGERMMRALLDAARDCGYEQAELDVVADNTAAKALYAKLGFEKRGVFPRSMKYTDGTYADAEWMVKYL